METIYSVEEITRKAEEISQKLKQGAYLELFDVEREFFRDMNLFFKENSIDSDMMIHDLVLTHSRMKELFLMYTNKEAAWEYLMELATLDGQVDPQEGAQGLGELEEDSIFELYKKLYIELLHKLYALCPVQDSFLLGSRGQLIDGIHKAHMENFLREHKRFADHFAGKE